MLNQGEQFQDIPDFQETMAEDIANGLVVVSENLPDNLLFCLLPKTCFPRHSYAHDISRKEVCRYHSYSTR